MFRTSSRTALCWRRSCGRLRTGMSSSASAVKDGKVIVNFKHTGDAPILRTAKFKVPADAPFHTVTALLRKALGLQVQDPLVCAHRTRAHCRALLSRGRIAGSSSTATAPSRPPRTSSCLTSPSASTWRACSCSTTASPQRGADANPLPVASQHAESRGSGASVPQAAAAAAALASAIIWLAGLRQNALSFLLAGRRIDACKPDGSIPNGQANRPPLRVRQPGAGWCVREVRAAGAGPP